MSILFDETGGVPLREVFGSLFATATEVDVAVTRINVAALDLTAAELGGLRLCRILVSRIDARFVQQRAALAPLAELVRSGRAEVRSAGIAGWMPDFSCFRSARMPSAGLVGAHYFSHPVAEHGPSFTCLLTEPAAVDRLQRRFDELWTRGYDVHAAVLGLLDST